MNTWKKFIGISLLAGVVGAAVLISCSQKPLDGELMAAPNPRALPELPKALRPQEKAVLEELRSVHFDYNKSDLKPEARKIIAENVKWLKAHPEVSVQIEGHCDERGTREFNYKLGEKRAEKTKALMVASGISADRISTVSYGAMSGQNENTWRNNRRAVFVLIYPGKKTPEDEVAKKQK